jgi:hypothetical protein
MPIVGQPVLGPVDIVDWPSSLVCRRLRHREPAREGHGGAMPAPPQKTVVGHRARLVSRARGHRFHPLLRHFSSRRRDRVRLTESHSFGSGPQLLTDLAIGPLGVFLEADMKCPQPQSTT